MQEVDGTGKKHSGTNDTNDTNDDLILTIIMRAAIRPSAASVGMSGSPGVTFMGGWSRSDSVRLRLVFVWAA